MLQTLLLIYHENKLKNNHSIFQSEIFQTNVSSSRNGYCRDTNILLLQYAVITIAIIFQVPAMYHMLYIFSFKSLKNSKAIFSIMATYSSQLSLLEKKKEEEEEKRIKGGEGEGEERKMKGKGSGKS